jgi:hypothetical protein
VPRDTSETNQDMSDSSPIRHTDGLHRIAAALDAVPQAAEPAPAEAAWA